MRKSDLYFAFWRAWISLLKKQCHRRPHIYLFILAPSASGSTLLHEILSESKAVAINNHLWAREGQSLPLVRDWMAFNTQKSFAEQNTFDWAKIHCEWLKYWNPCRKIFLDKSTLALFQGEAMMREFKEVYFLCLHRNPYALAEKYFSSSTMDKPTALKQVIDLLQQQRKNIEQLPRSLSISYTELTQSPEEVLQKLTVWLPDLGLIPLKTKYTAHNSLGRSLEICNLDPHKIRRLSPNDIAVINSELIKHQDMMEFFGYSFIKSKTG